MSMGGISHGIGIGVGPIDSPSGGPPEGEVWGSVNAALPVATLVASGTHTINAVSSSVSAALPVATLVAAGTHAPLLTRQVKTFIASGTWTEPAWYQSPAGVASQARARCWGSAGGGTLSVGAGGGGAFSEEPACVPGGNVTITIGTVAAGSDGGDSSFGSACIAKGGLSGLNGGTGGTAAASTGTTKFSGGNGQVGAGNTIGGGGAGDISAGSGITPGASTGGFDTVAVAGRILSSGGSSQAAGQQAGGRGEVRVDVDIPATPGYPRPRARSTGRDTANGTSRAATMPSGIVAGELLVAVVISDGIPDITAAGWTKLGQENEGTSQVSGAWFYKVAAGADTMTIATDASEMVAYMILRVAGAGTPEFADASGNSTNADPPSKVYSGGSIKGLALAVAGWDQLNAGATAIPAGYDSWITIPCQQAVAPTLACCELLAETDTFNPGAYTSATEQWVAATIVIPPA